MTTIASGVIMRVGNYDTNVYPGRSQREVHPARRHESITYRIEQTSADVQVEDGWEHFAYRFHYRYQGRTMSVAWRCGTLYGQPKPTDGLSSAFLDASTVEWEAFGQQWADEYGYEDYAQARRVYRQCEQMNERLDTFFEYRTEREAWENAVREN